MGVSIKTLGLCTVYFCKTVFSESCDKSFTVKKFLIYVDFDKDFLLKHILEIFFLIVVDNSKQEKIQMLYVDKNAL